METSFYLRFPCHPREMKTPDPNSNYFRDRNGPPETVPKCIKTHKEKVRFTYQADQSTQYGDLWGKPRMTDEWTAQETEGRTEHI